VIPTAASVNYGRALRMYAFGETDRRTLRLLQLEKRLVRRKQELASLSWVALVSCFVANFIKPGWIPFISLILSSAVLLTIVILLQRKLKRVHRIWRKSWIRCVQRTCSRLESPLQNKS